MKRWAALLTALFLAGGCAKGTDAPAVVEVPAPAAVEVGHPVPDALWPLPGGNRWPGERWSPEWWSFAGDKLLVLRTDGKALEALDQHLSVLWSAPLPAKATRVHYESRGRRAVVEMGDRAVALDLANGALLGDAPAPGSEGSTLPSVVRTFPDRGGRYHLTTAGDRVYHEDFQGTITVYDLTGKELWSRRAEVRGEAYAREWPDHGGRTRFIIAPRRGRFTVYDENGEALFSGRGMPDIRFPDWLLSGDVGPHPKELIDRTGRTVWRFATPQTFFTLDGKWVYDFEPFEAIRAYRVPAAPK